MVSILGLDKAVVLKALHDASKPQGMGFIHFQPEGLSVGECRNLLLGSKYFDYLQGRVMKIDLSTDFINPRDYDRDNGEGAVARVINSLRGE